MKKAMKVSDVFLRNNSTNPQQFDEFKRKRVAKKRIIAAIESNYIKPVKDAEGVIYLALTAKGLALIAKHMK